MRAADRNEKDDTSAVYERGLKTHSWLVGAACAFICCAAYAGTPALIDPGIPHMERSVYRLTREDGSVSTSTHLVALSEENDEKLYLIKTFDKKMLLRRNNLTPINITKWKKNDAGENTDEVDWEIRYEKDRVHYIFPGPTRNKVEKVDENRYDANAIVHTVRGFPFEKKKEVKLTLVTHDHRLGVYFKIVGRELASAPVGEFDCYKIQAGLSGWKGRIMTKKLYFWVEAEAPHRLIRQIDEGITDVRLTELAEYEVGVDHEEAER
ncbi:MAG: hypothetical protein OXT69_00475 [Candidatus Poribacteria bacterium]|nr:hypothetical protein [Candidatus Poribacteria bacterium]